MKFYTSTVAIIDSVGTVNNRQTKHLSLCDIPAVKDHEDKDGAAPFPMAQNHHFTEIDPSPKRDLGMMLDGILPWKMQTSQKHR